MVATIKMNARASQHIFQQRLVQYHCAAMMMCVCVWCCDRTTALLLIHTHAINARAHTRDLLRCFIRYRKYAELSARARSISHLRDERNEKKKKRILSSTISLHIRSVVICFFMHTHKHTHSYKYTESNYFQICEMILCFFFGFFFLCSLRRIFGWAFFFFVTFRFNMRAVRLNMCGTAAVAASASTHKYRFMRGDDARRRRNRLKLNLFCITTHTYKYSVVVWASVCVCVIVIPQIRMCVYFFWRKINTIKCGPQPQTNRKYFW